MTSSVLRNFGYQVIEAVDGVDATEKYVAQAKEIDLLLLDVIMPRMGGKEVFDTIRSLDPALKVLFISGYSGDSLQKKGIFEEGVHFLSKPMSPFALLREVRTILDGND
jgi:CheY-like chemotaxis protein